MLPQPLQKMYYEGVELNKWLVIHVWRNIQILRDSNRLQCGEYNSEFFTNRNNSMYIQPNLKYFADVSIWTRRYCLITEYENRKSRSWHFLLSTYKVTKDRCCAEDVLLYSIIREIFRRGLHRPCKGTVERISCCPYLCEAGYCITW